MFEDILGKDKNNSEVPYGQSHFNCPSCNYTVVKSTFGNGAEVCPICSGYMTSMSVTIYDGNDYFGATNISC